MRILVTGGAGFIGSHVVDGALQRGHQVWVVDNFSSGKRENVASGAELVELDIRDGQKLAELVAKVKPDAIAHQAAQVSVSVSTREPLRDAEINVLGSLNVANAAVASKVGRLVFASTGGAIYGEVPEGKRAREGDPMIPMSPYGCSKLAFEGYLPYYREALGLPCTVLRYGNVYGPRQDPHGEAGVVAIFAQRLRDGQPLQINAMLHKGDDGCVRDYVYVKDVVAANLAALEGRVAEPIMNVGTGLPTSTKQLIGHLQKELGGSSPINYAERRAGDLMRSLLDATRCGSVIGAPTSLAEGLTETARWFKARG